MPSENNKDILFKNKEVTYHFSYLPWDTEFFQRPCFVLDTGLSHLGILDHQSSNSLADMLKGSFITAKIGTNVDHQVIKSLLTLGFYYVETEVTLELKRLNHSIEKDVVNGKNIVVEEREINTDLPYFELGSSFMYTRFHTDSCISDKLADDLWVSYLKNYKPDENHHMIIAKYKDQIAGTILANVSDNEVMLFFVAIRKEFQGKGIGSALIDYVAGCFDDHKIITGSQIKNIPALNYYIKNGFSKIISTKTVLHRWE